VFSSTRGKRLDLYLKAVGGTTSEQLLFESNEIKAASDWSPDGRFVLYSAAATTGDFDIWAIPVGGDRRPFPVVQTKSNDRLGQFSPTDGKWFAFESNESNRYEVYVQPFPADGRSGAKVPVTTKGGAQARWRHDGKALFYIALDVAAQLTLLLNRSRKRP
jgi:Tol biopolymer transport system component